MLLILVCNCSERKNFTFFYLSNCMQIHYPQRKLQTFYYLKFDFLIYRLAFFLLTCFEIEDKVLFSIFVLNFVANYDGETNNFLQFHKTVTSIIM